MHTPATDHIMVFPVIASKNCTLMQKLTQLLIFSECVMQDTQIQLQAASLKEGRLQEEVEGVRAALADSQKETLRLTQVGFARGYQASLL